MTPNYGAKIPSNIFLNTIFLSQIKYRLFFFYYFFIRGDPLSSFAATHRPPHQIRDSASSHRLPLFLLLLHPIRDKSSSHRLPLVLVLLHPIRDSTTICSPITRLYVDVLRRNPPNLPNSSPTQIPQSKS